ncbi:hypothetical protein CGRA01v4_08857 [Colletotrichum graminicola]|nr:hypothetical protein CGRA01v4_08857 [Colletotrichum graminicola]
MWKRWTLELERRNRRQSVGISSIQHRAARPFHPHETTTTISVFRSDKKGAWCSHVASFFTGRVWSFAIQLTLSFHQTETDKREHPESLP